MLPPKRPVESMICVFIRASGPKSYLEKLKKTKLKKMD